MIVEFLITPDSSHIVYVSGEENYRNEKLYLIPTDGSAPVKELSSPFSPFQLSDTIRITPNSQHIIYSVDQGSYEPLYREPIHSNLPPAVIYECSDFDCSVEHFEPTPDGSRIIFVSERDDIYSLRINGTEPPIKLNSDSRAIEKIEFNRFTTNTDGSRVAFTGSGPSSLFTSFTDGSGTSKRVAQYNYRRGHITDYQLSPDGSYIIYLLENDRRNDIYYVPFDGSSPPRPLHVPAEAPYTNIEKFQISPDSVYTARHH